MKFRMVDRITEYEPQKSICGVKVVSFEEYQLKAAFGGELCLPESLIMESFFQLGNWLIMLSSGFSQMGLLVRTNEVKFDKQVYAGQNMLMEIAVSRYREDGVLFDGYARVDGQIVAKGTGCLANLVKLDEFYDPADMKVLFSEIYRPEKGC